LDENGEQLGIMSSQEANRLANSKGLDLVKINATSKPPVCKIMDYGKFKFDTVKREKELKKNQKNSELREMRISMNIDKHDMETKARQTVKLLSAGDKVKISIRMKGREQAHAKLGVDVMDSFFAMCEEVGEVDIKPHTEGRNIFMILKPKKVEKPTKGSHLYQKKVDPNPPKNSNNSSVQSLGDKLNKANQKPANGADNNGQKPVDGADNSGQKPADAESSSTFTKKVDNTDKSSENKATKSDNKNSQADKALKTDKSSENK